MGYRGVARVQPRSARTVTIGLIIKAPKGDAPEVNRFYAPVMTGVEEMCRARGVDLLFASMPVDDTYHPLEVPRLVSDRGCSGLVVIGTHLSSGTAAMLEGGPPVVLVDAYAEDRDLDSVVSDNVGGARVAVDHLRALGHREIVLVGTQPDAFPSILQRRRGYLEAIAEAGLRSHLVDASHIQPMLAAEATVGYLATHPEVTAAFCSNDEVACAVIEAVRRTGAEMPRRLSVVGFDDVDMARFVSPQLTTLAVDKVGMGRMAVNLLLHRLEHRGDAPIQALLRPRLVERASAVPRAG
jgi:DNA-binding LacI/PurR family transcriptional regulator